VKILLFLSLSPGIVSFIWHAVQLDDEPMRGSTRNAINYTWSSSDRRTGSNKSCPLVLQRQRVKPLKTARNLPGLMDRLILCPASARASRCRNSNGSHRRRWRWFAPVKVGSFDVFAGGRSRGRGLAMTVLCRVEMTRRALSRPLEKLKLLHLGIRNLESRRSQHYPSNFKMCALLLLLRTCLRSHGFSWHDHSRISRHLGPL